MEQDTALSEIRRGDSGNRLSLSDQVYEHLTDRIIRGDIQYGDRLNIKTIAGELGVSPMPIRDALKRLEFENVVTIKARSSCYVRVPTKKATLDAVDARRMTEVFALRQVYRSATAEDLTELRRIVGDMERLAKRMAANRTRSSIEEYIELDRHFHTAICAIARNDYLDRFYRQISMHLNMSFRYGSGVCHGIEQTLQEHKEILDGLYHNSEHAVDALEEHLLQSRENILNEPTFQLLED